MSERNSWSINDFRHRSKTDLYGSTGEKRRSNWGLKFMGMLVVFWILSNAITPWTGVYSWRHAFPELGFRLEDSTYQCADAIVIGSSTTLHHIVPSLLDSSTTHSWYNFGFQSATPPESFFIAHELINTAKQTQIKTLVFEVLPSEWPNAAAYGSTRIEAQLNGLEVIRRIRNLPWAREEMHDANWEQCKLLFNGGLHHMTGFLRKIYDKPNPSDPFNGESSRGFLPLQKDDWKSGRLKDARLHWMNGSDSLMAHQVLIAKDFDFRWTLSDPTVNWDCDGLVDPIVRQMEALKLQCESNGIQCIFLFQKLWGSNGCVYFEAHERWGDAHIIQKMGYAGNEDLFNPDERYDENHFLGAGARRFTQSVGQDFIRILHPLE